MRLAEEAIDREARRVLRRLAAPRQALIARPAGGFAVARACATVAQSRVTLGAEFVQAFVRAGWIVPDGATADKTARFVLAEAGRAFLARSLGGDDKFADQHRLLQSRVLDGRAVRVNAGESPLARLRFRDLLDDTQFAAGEKLRRDFTLGQLTPRMGVDLSAPVVSGGARGGAQEHVSDIAIAARQRFSRAVAAAGPGLGDLLFDVCCHLIALEAAEAQRGWAKRSGRVVLKIALDRLAAHYGMTVKGGAAGIRAWALEESQSAIG